MSSQLLANKEKERNCKKNKKNKTKQKETKQKNNPVTSALNNPTKINKASNKQTELFRYQYMYLSDHSATNR